MATNVLMPKWGMSMSEGLVGTWLKAEGDRVEQGEEIVEIESDKAINLVESPAAGILARILVPEGETVPITTVIAVIGEPGEEITDVMLADSPNQAVAEQKVASQEIEDCKQTSAVTSRQAVGVRRRVAASPAARRLARERGIDLTDVTATGPDGMIVVDDVQRVFSESLGATAAQAAQPAPSTPPISRVAFYSQGHKLDGLLYLPKTRLPEQQLPAVVFCLGFTYVKDLLVPDMARRFSEQGFAALVFDYRGFGGSEGPRGRLLPLEQVTDIRSAVTYLAARPEVDAGRIGLAGISLGGSHALYVAGIDRRVQAAAAIAPVGNCRRWLKGTRRHWEWVEFLHKLEADRTARALSGQGEQIDAWDIISPDPASNAFLDSLYREFPDLKSKLSLESADALIDYCAENVVEQISPRPVLIVHGNDDLLVPVDESRSLFAKCGEPRKLVVVPGMAHFDWANPQDKRFVRVMDILGDWFGEHLLA